MILTYHAATGSSACNLALVAAGECDIYWDNGMWAWDVAVSLQIPALRPI